MAWRFPLHPFDVITATTEYINCSLIDADPDILTIDRDCVMVFGRLIRLRTQVRIEDIRAIHEHAVQTHAGCALHEAFSESCASCATLAAKAARQS